MVKRDLVKFLEKARYVKKDHVSFECQKALTEIRDKALAKMGFDVTALAVQKHLDKALTIYKNWADENNRKNGVRVKTEYYCYLPSILYQYTKGKDACYNTLLVEQVQIETDDMTRIKKEHKAMQEQIEANFNTVIATVEEMKTVKDAAVYLKELGFDLSELEKPPTPVMLAKRVEPRFLLVEQKAA